MLPFCAMINLNSIRKNIGINLMSKPKLFLVNPTEAVDKVKGIFSKHIRTLSNYVASTRVSLATSGVFTTENFTYKVLIPAAAIFAGQEILVAALQEPSTTQTLKNLVGQSGYVEGIAKYVSDYAFQHSSMLNNAQDMTVASIVASVALKLAEYGFNKATMKVGDVQDQVFKHIASDIYYRYSELVEDPKYSELSAFKAAYDESSTVIENLDLEATQKQKLLAVISNKLTKAVEFHKELELQRG